MLPAHAFLDQPATIACRPECMLAPRGSPAYLSALLQVYLRHVDTNHWLVMANKQYGRPISGQYEVAASTKRDTAAAWRAAEGVYFPRAELEPPAAGAAPPGAARAGAAGTPSSEEL